MERDVLYAVGNVNHSSDNGVAAAVSSDSSQKLSYRQIEDIVKTTARSHEEPGYIANRISALVFVCRDCGIQPH